MKQSWYKFNALAGDKPAEILIYDEIGMWGVDAKAFVEDLRGVEGKDLSVRIHSPGGSIMDGCAIANALKAHSGTVSVQIDGLCASIATVVAMAGDTVRMAENGFFMIHNPWVFAMGDSDEMRKMADIMDKMKGNIVKAYTDKTGKSDDEISELMDAETWLTAEEAKDLGFIDSIIKNEAEEEDEEMKNFDLSKFRNSAKFSGKKQNSSRAESEAGASGETGKPVVTWQSMKAASEALFKASSVKQTSVTQTNQTKPKDKHMENTNPAQLSAAEIEAKANEIAEAKFKARTARINEVNAIVAQAKARGDGDFSNEATSFLATDKPASEFLAQVFNAPKSQKSPAVGSGAEVIEPLDALKGTPGFDIVTSDDFKAVHEGWTKKGRHGFSLNLNIPQFRNTQTSTGLTAIEYKPGVAQLGVRQLRIKELISGGATNNTTIRGRRESAFANAAATVTETGALPALSVSYEEVDYPVKDIGGYIEMSENLLADYLAIGSFINSRVPYMVERTVEDQLLNGDGTSSNITGLLATSNIQTQAKSGDTAVDAIYKAITIVRFVPNGVQANVQGGYEPDAIVINPTDWQNIRLAKDTANQYYGGGPFTGAYGNGAFSNVDMLWGKMVVITPAIAAGTALVGAFKQCSQWFQRQGLTIELTNSNGTNFINRIVTLRAAERLALTVDLPNGFCQVTGL